MGPAPPIICHLCLCLSVSFTLICFCLCNNSASFNVHGDNCNGSAHEMNQTGVLNPQVESYVNLNVNIRREPPKGGGGVWLNCTNPLKESSQYITTV